MPLVNVSMSEMKELAVKEQRTIVFYDDELTAVRAEDGQIYASIAQMCKAIGLDVQGQYQRMQRHTVLANGIRVCKIHAPSRGSQTANTLRVDLVPLWLSGIRTKSIKDEDKRLKVEVFQNEAAKVLWEAFQDGRLSSNNQEIEEMLDADTPAAQAYKMIMAMAKMARQQLLHEAKLEEHNQQLEDYGERIEQLESTLGNPDRFVTPEQASNISQAVKAIAIELSRASGKNEFGGVYGEMYRRAGVTSYKEIPASKYEEVMTWLRDWYGSLADDMPF